MGLSQCLNNACDIDSQDVRIVPPLISLGGNLIVDRIETRGADSDQGFVNRWARYQYFTDAQTGGRTRFIEKNSFHEIGPYICQSKFTQLFSAPFPFRIVDIAFRTGSVESARLSARSSAVDTEAGRHGRSIKLGRSTRD